jgi:hypothetical protein
MMSPGSLVYLQALPVQPETATAWVLGNGAMLSVDKVFTDM